MLHFKRPVQFTGRSPESHAYAFITVSRKAVEVPELKTAIASGTLNLSTAKRVVSVIERSNQKEWIRKASTLSQRNLEREVVRQA